MIEHIPCTREIGMKTTATHARKNAHIVLLDFTLSGFPKPLGDTILTDELSSTTTNHLTATCQAFALNLRVTIPQHCLLNSDDHDRLDFRAKHRPCRYSWLVFVVSLVCCLLACLENARKHAF